MTKYLKKNCLISLLLLMLLLMTFFCVFAFETVALADIQTAAMLVFSYKSGKFKFSTFKNNVVIDGRCEYLAGSFSVSDGWYASVLLNSEEGYSKIVQLTSKDVYFGNSAKLKSHAPSAGDVLSFMDMTDGYYTLTLLANYGTSSDSITYKFYFDSDAPQLTVRKGSTALEFPSNNTLYWNKSHGNTIKISAEDVFLRGFTFENGNGTVTDYLSVAGDENEITLTQGINKITAWDIADNVVEYVIYYDIISPSLAFKNVSYGSNYYGVNSTVTIDVFDYCSGVNSLRSLAIDGDIVRVASGTYVCDSSMFNLGWHTVTATDLSGNTATAKFYTDVTAPTIAIYSKSGSQLYDYSKTNEYVTFSVADDSESYSTRIYRRNGNDWTVLPKWNDYIKKTIYYDKRIGYPTDITYSTKSLAENALYTDAVALIEALTNWNSDVVGEVPDSEQIYAIIGSNYWKYTDAYTERSFIFFDADRAKSWLKTYITRYVDSGYNYFYEEGEFKIEVTDAAHNVVTKYFYIDVTAPTLSVGDYVTVIDNDYYTNHTVSVSAYDVNFQFLYYRKDDSTWQYTTERTFNIEEDGDYQLYVTDNFGNVSEVIGVHFNNATTLGNVPILENGYKQSYWYVVTLPGRVFGNEAGKYSFSNFEAALSYAKKKEKEYRCSAINGGYSYVTVSNESVYTIYATEEAVDAAIMYYATTYVSEVQYFENKASKNNYYTIMSDSGDTNEGALTTNIVSLPEWWECSTDKVILASIDYIPKMFCKYMASITLDYIASDSSYVSPVNIAIGYGQSFKAALTSAGNLYQGYYSYVETDICGNSERVILYFDLSAPTLNMSLTRGIDTSNVTVSETSLALQNTYYALSCSLLQIIDNVDSIAMVKIEGVVSGIFNDVTKIPPLNAELGSGAYKITIYDRSYNSLSFTVYIAGVEPSLYHTSLTNTTKLSISILLNDKNNALLELHFFKIDAKGGYSEILIDSDGKTVNVADLDYVLREGGKYTFILVDVYGRHIELEPFFYEKGLPTGTLSCRNGAVTNKSVTFSYSSENYILEVYDVTAGHTKYADYTESTNNGTTTVLFSAIDELNKTFLLFMYNAYDESLFIEYKFTIDTIPPAVEVTTLSGIGVEQNGATNQSFYLTWDEADASVHYSLGISSTTPKSYVKGTMLSSKGLYTFTIKDAVGNILTFTVYLDNQCDVGFEGNYSFREDGTIVTNSAVTVRQKEEYKVFTVSTDNGITVRLDTAFSANGTYELFFQDLYLNTVSYIIIINNIPPIITLSGVVADATTSSDVKVDFDKGSGIIEYNKETFSCADGQMVTEHGAYKVTVKDEFGNVASVKFAIDKKVEYKSNVACGIVTTSRVTLEFTEKLKNIELKINGSVANLASSSFNDSGLYEIMAEDLFGNQLIFTFTIIEAKTKATEFIAPSGFDISYVQKSGTMLVLNNTHVFNYCGDGVYTIALAEKQTSCVYAFDIEVDTTKPSLSIVYSDDGKEVTFASLTKNVTGTLTLDGKEIAWTPNKVLKDVGKYKLIIVDELGNEVIYEFEIIKHLNVWAIISIIIVVLIIAAVIFLIVKAKKTKAE